MGTEFRGSVFQIPWIFPMQHLIFSLNIKSYLVLPNNSSPRNSSWLQRPKTYLHIFLLLMPRMLHESWKWRGWRQGWGIARRSWLTAGIRDALSHFAKWHEQGISNDPMYCSQSCRIRKWFLSSSKMHLSGFPGGAVVENLPASAGDTGSSPGLGRSHMPQSN